MKVLQNQIYCLIPFYFDKLQETVAGELWKEQAPCIDSDAMYPYMSLGSRSNKVYALNPAGKADIAKFMTQTSFVRNMGKQSQALAVNIMNAGQKSWRTPRLLLSGDGETGTLILPLTISAAFPGELLPLDTVCDFVNKLHKYDSTQTLVFEYRTKNGNTIVQDQLDSVLGLTHKGQDHTWTIGSLSNLLLGSMLGDITMFKPFRAHILTQVLVDDDEGRAHVFTEDDKIALLRITHCQNSRYHTVLDERSAETILSLFANIHVGISVEGACCMQVIQHDDGDAFLTSYANGPFQSRFMWLYINAFVQRHMLLNVDRQLADAAAFINGKVSIGEEHFHNTVSKLCAMRLRGLFANVSAYSHINAQNDFVLRKLDIFKLYAELNDKLQSIDTWLKLVEAQQQNEAAELLKQESEKRHKFEKFLQEGAMIVAILALLYGIPQCITALNDTWRDSLWGWSIICTVPAIIGMAWLIFLMVKSRR